MITDDELTNLRGMVRDIHRCLDEGNSSAGARAAAGLTAFADELDRRIGRPTEVEHQWLSAVLNAAKGGYDLEEILRKELRPKLVLGQTPGVFDVKLHDGTWLRVAVSQLAGSQSVLHAEDERR